MEMFEEESYEVPNGDPSSTAIETIEIVEDITEEEYLESHLEVIYQQIKEVSDRIDEEIEDILKWLQKRYNSEIEPSVEIKVEPEEDEESDRKRKRTPSSGEEEEENYLGADDLDDQLEENLNNSHSIFLGTKKDEVFIMVDDMSTFQSMTTSGSVSVDDIAEELNRGPIKKVTFEPSRPKHMSESDKRIKMDGIDAFPTKPPKMKAKATFGCKVCAYQTTMASAMDEHNIRHERIEEVRRGLYYFCIYCDFASRFKNEKNTHIAKVHGNEYVECEVPNCHQEVTVNKLDIHLYDKHPYYWLEKVMAHKDAIVGGRGILGEQNLNEALEKQICAVCGTQTKNAYGLLMHYRNMGQNHKPECPRCGEKYRSWEEHQEHVWSKHENVWKWQCGRCRNHTVLYDTQAELKKHYGTHKNTDNSRVPCKICGEMVNGRLMYRHNAKVHGAVYDSKLQCGLCKFKAKAQKTMDKHVDNYHNYIRCEYCGKEIKGKMNLNYHYLSCKNGGGGETKDGTRHRCDICGKTYKFQNSLKEHQKENH